MSDEDTQAGDKNIMGYILTFGKYKGQDIEKVYQLDADYIRWVADNSYIATAKRAANDLLRASMRKDEDTSEALLAALKAIGKSKPHPALKKYRHIEREVHRDYACISFCTHAISTGAGIDFDIFEEDWDMVQLATSHEGLEEVDEEDYDFGHEQPRYRRPPGGPTPTAEASIWYAFRDNSGRDPLNTNPVTLAEAVEIIEEYLVKKKG